MRWGLRAKIAARKAEQKKGGSATRAIQNEGEIVERKPLTAWETYAQALLFAGVITVGAKAMSTPMSMMPPETSSTTTQAATILKKRVRTAPNNGRRSGGSSWAMATGRRAQIMSAMPPIHTIAAAR